MKERSRPDRGFIDQKQIARGPNGLPCCRYCGTECAPPRRTFCSDGCVHEWKIRSQPGYARAQVYKRDGGACANGCAVVFAVRRSRRYGCNVSIKVWEMDHVVPVSEGGGACGLDNLRTLCVPCHRKETAALAARRALSNRTP